LPCLLPIRSARSLMHALAVRMGRTNGADDERVEDAANHHAQYGA
jgi:hypothetical protein